MTSDNQTPNMSTNRWLHIIGDETLPNKDDLEKFCCDQEGKNEWQEMEEFNEAVFRTFGPRHDEQEAWNRFSEKLEDESVLAETYTHRKQKNTNYRLRRISNPPRLKKKIWSIVFPVIGIAATILFAIFFIMRHDIFGSDVLYEAKENMQDVIMKSESGGDISIKEQHLIAQNTLRTEMRTIIVPAGKTVDLILSDSTHIWINENSSLTYPTHFGKDTRKVRLDGEAYFKVSHDSKRPFIVQSGSMETHVLGTEFNVRSYKGSQPHVTLVNGLVEVRTADSKVKVHPGEDATAVSGGVNISQVNVMDIVEWHRGIIFFDDAPIRNVLIEICKWYNFNLVSNNTKLLDTHVRFEFQRNEGVEDVVGVLNQFADNKITIKGNTIYLQ